MLISEKDKIRNPKKDSVKQTFLQFHQNTKRKRNEKINPAAFAGLKSVYNQVKKSDKDITREDVRKYLEEEDTYNLHKPKRNTRYPTLGYLATAPNSDWQADLADFQMLKEQNKGFSFLLVCIDVLSKKIYAEPLKTKSPVYVLEGFKKIINSAKTAPIRLVTDAGKEFEAKIMQTFYERNGIIKKVVYSEHHAGIAERAIRTIKERLYRYFTLKRTNVWIDVIDKIVEAINSSVNRSIGMAPNDVTDEKANEIYEQVFRPKIKGRAKIAKGDKFNVGDLVRLNKWKGVFGKGYTANYTKELFRITEAKTSFPPHYRIEDLNGEKILGVYYPQDFSRVRIGENERVGKVISERNSKKGKEFKVQWINENKEEWLTESNRYKII